MSSTVNSAFELTGTVREGRAPRDGGSNADSATRTSRRWRFVTFRNRIPARRRRSRSASLNTSGRHAGSPSSYFADRDGSASSATRRSAGSRRRFGGLVVHRDRVRRHRWPSRDHRHRGSFSAARCDCENRVARERSRSGSATSRSEDSVVPLPECPTCRSRGSCCARPNERAGNIPDGQLGHLHRLIVDELHAELVKNRGASSNAPWGRARSVTKPIAAGRAPALRGQGLEAAGAPSRQLRARSPASERRLHRRRQRRRARSTGIVVPARSPRTPSIAFPSKGNERARSSSSSTRPSRAASTRPSRC